VGKYKVELYLNDQLVQTLEYVVQEAGAQTPFVESATLAKGYEEAKRWTRPPSLPKMT